MTTILVIVTVSAALVAGAAWGIYTTIPPKLLGFIVALAGGALIVSAMLELIDPATEHASVWWVCAFVALGATVFTVVDYLIDEHWGSDSGGGLLAAITLDGIPENLALGVALIGVGPTGAGALAGSILLSNLPEAAGGAQAMADGGRSNSKVLVLWTVTAVVLSGAALAGNLLLEGASDTALALIRALAGGAVVASLATEVFPKAFREDSYLAGIAASLGLILAVLLDHL